MKEVLYPDIDKELSKYGPYLVLIDYGTDRWLIESAGTFEAAVKLWLEKMQLGNMNVLIAKVVTMQIEEVE